MGDNFKKEMFGDLEMDDLEAIPLSVTEDLGDALESFDAVKVDEPEDFAGKINTLLIDVDDDGEPDIKITTWEDDGDHSKFIDFIKGKLNSIPPHSGDKIIGVRRAIQHLEDCKSEINQAIRSDKNREIDDEEAEEIYHEVNKGIKRLKKRLEELERGMMEKDADLVVSKKVFARINNGDDVQFFLLVSAGGQEELFEVELEQPSSDDVEKFAKIESAGFSKEASATYSYEDPFMRTIVKMLINAHITHGKNIVEAYNHLAKKYNFNDREHLTIQSMLEDTGLSFNKDLTRIGDEDFKPHDGKSLNQTTVYQA